MGGIMNREMYLRTLILEKHTLKEFADKINMPYSTLLSILKNVGGASIDNIKKICAGLGISLDVLDFTDAPEVLVNFRAPRPLSDGERKRFQRLLNAFVDEEKGETTDD